VKTVDLPVSQLHEAPWNANRMDAPMMARLKESIRRYGLVQNLVVRKTRLDYYEVLSGNQRLALLRESGAETVPCVIVDLSDADARVLAQALNRIQGEDDLGLKASLLKDILKHLPEEAVMAVLPETSSSLKGLASLGSDTVARYLTTWENTRHARLKHLQFQLTAEQLETVEKALAKVMSRARRIQGDSPNLRGTALYVLCRKLLEEDER
jgi:ParB family chromosome partitioning protein